MSPKQGRLLWLRLAIRTKPKKSKMNTGMKLLVSVVELRWKGVPVG